jgi:N-methylhydantoinase A/oxoprolinase/acetone carboxylase beta subunit
VHDGAALATVPVWDRAALAPEDSVVGPALIEEAFATHWIAAGWTARLCAAGALIVRRC